MYPLHLIDEISHRVVNEYTEAICALGQAASAARDAQLALTSAANRLRAQVEAHRALQAPTVDGPMDLADYVGQLCACLAKAPLAQNGLRLRVTADEVWLDASRCWRVGLVVAELVRNAARHGLADGAGAIWVVGKTSPAGSDARSATMAPARPTSAPAAAAASSRPSRPSWAAQSSGASPRTAAGPCWNSTQRGSLGSSRAPRASQTRGRFSASARLDAVQP
jgi:two-component sensor histidine kinase